MGTNQRCQPRVANQNEDHNQQVSLRCGLHRCRGTVGNSASDVFDDPGPEKDGHGPTDDDEGEGLNHRQDDGQGADLARCNVHHDDQRDDRENVINEGRRDYQLPIVGPQFFGLRQQLEGDANGRGRQRTAQGKTVGKDRPAKGQDEEDGRADGEERPEDGNNEGPEPDDAELLELDVHSTLENHHRHPEHAACSEPVRVILLLLQ
mmetsp:Transcript_129764/g.224297  ORF Transcript_129764/g.224297 Transcript_129764/m.224297 type:complete len:206 (+) Transcript_129764:3465-4082(+)